MINHRAVLFTVQSLFLTITQLKLRPALIVLYMFYNSHKTSKFELYASFDI
nr:MAG TPA: hypothetical protein [Caudoviricetes sp.]